jgi:hypothetical protein
VISEANLVLIAVMVVIFGAALLIPFPGYKSREGSFLPEIAPDGDEEVIDSTRHTLVGLATDSTPRAHGDTARPID